MSNIVYPPNLPSVSTLPQASSHRDSLICNNRELYYSTGNQWLGIARKTNTTITIYVDNVNGNNTTGTGSSTQPYATFARAMQEVGEFLNANVTIVLKKSATSYETLNLTGRSRTNPSAVLTIQGEFDTLVTGTVSSFSNSVNDPVYDSSVTVARITDSTKNWTTDQWKHKVLRIYKGVISYYRIITNNDATNLYCSYTFPVTIDNTWSYEILDWGTTVSQIVGFDCSCYINIFGINVSANHNSGVHLEDTGYYGFVLTYCRVSISSSQTSPAIELNKSHVTLMSSIIDGNNASIVIGGILRSITTGGSAYIQGTIFDRCSSPAIATYPDYVTINFHSGSRIYRGTTNPSIGILLTAGLFNTWSSYGTCVIDCGTNGFWVEANGSVRGITSLYFGSNVTNRTNVSPGSADGAILGSNLVANVLNYQNVHSRLQVAGSVATQITTVSANTTLGIDHHIVLVNASGDNRTITLPSASGITGRQYIIKKIDSSSNTVTISAQTGQTIDGQTSMVLNTQYQFIGIVSDGSNWFRIE